MIPLADYGKGAGAHQTLHASSVFSTQMDHFHLDAFSVYLRLPRTWRTRKLIGFTVLWTAVHSQARLAVSAEVQQLQQQLSTDAGWVVDGTVSIVSAVFLHSLYCMIEQAA